MLFENVESLTNRANHLVCHSAVVHQVCPSRAKKSWQVIDKDHPVCHSFAKWSWHVLWKAYQNRTDHHPVCHSTVKQSWQVLTTKFNRISTASPGTQRHHWGIAFDLLKYFFDHTTIHVRSIPSSDWDIACPMNTGSKQSQTPP